MQQLGGALCGAKATRFMSFVRWQRTNAPAASSASSILCGGPLLFSGRCYFWPYNEDFVPKGATTSGFQSSASPNTRQRVLQEYALSPLFGARVPCCRLGTMKSAREMVDVKKEIALLLCEMVRLRAGSVSLGPLVQTTEMMLFKPDTPLSPRLGDDRSSGMHAYGRRPIAARTLMDVFLPEEMALDEVAAIGRLVQEKLSLAQREEDSCINNETDRCISLADGVSPARVLVSRMAIVFCEVPPVDETGFLFDAVGGVSIDAEEAERVVERWQARGE